MSIQNEESLMDHISGVGIGASLLIFGLVMTIAGPGIMLGLPLILLGLLVPLGMTYNARTESQHQAARRRPERDSNATYSIQSKKRSY